MHNRKNQYTKLIISFLLALSVVFISSCSSSIVSFIKQGYMAEQKFSAQTNFEQIHGLVIVPVMINGKNYRFLFDTGAPTAISQQLNNDLKLKVQHKGKITDSDKKKSKIEYVSLDSLLVGGVAFYNQSCIVVDFDKNPKLKCMQLDGILGSNTMRFCNWRIDFYKQEIGFSNHFVDTTNKSFIPFETDHQYDININLNLDTLVLKNIKIDYGSNGALSLPKSVLIELDKKNAIMELRSHYGFSQSGISGKITKIDELYCQFDSLYYKDLVFRNIPIYNGTGLLGCKILSNWIVEIDWDHQKLYFTPQNEMKYYLNSFGMSINYSNEKGTYIQSVIEGSIAENNGIAPNMEILKINDLYFNSESDFCNYLIQKKKDPMRIKLLNQNKDTLNLVLEKSPIISTLIKP
jgi:hypothetical protein